MIELKDNKIMIPIETWEKLKEDEYFHELIQILEDSEILKQAIEDTEYFIDFDEYLKNREIKDV